MKELPLISAGAPLEGDGARFEDFQTDVAAPGTPLSRHVGKGRYAGAAASPKWLPRTTIGVSFVEIADPGERWIWDDFSGLA